jgi:hypothetical protein
MDHQGGFSLRDRWTAQPLWFTFLFLAVLGSVLFGLWIWVSDLDQEVRMPGVAVLSGVLFGLPFGGIMTLVQRSIRKKSGIAELDWNARLAVVRALRTGRLPDDPSLHPGLRRSVAYHLDQARKVRGGAPFLYGILLVVAVFSTVVFGPVFVLLGVWAVAAGAYAFFSSARTVARLTELERVLSEQ